MGDHGKFSGDPITKWLTESAGADKTKRLGVRIGAAWSTVPAWAPALAAHDRGARFQRFATEVRMEADFQHLAEMLLSVRAREARTSRFDLTAMR